MGKVVDVDSKTPVLDRVDNPADLRELARDRKSVV